MDPEDSALRIIPAELFRLLREFDHLGAREVYVRCPDADGVGLAVYNRLIRAAAFTFIDLD